MSSVIGEAEGAAYCTLPASRCFFVLGFFFNSGSGSSWMFQEGQFHKPAGQAFLVGRALSDLQLRPSDCSLSDPNPCH